MQSLHSHLLIDSVPSPRCLQSPHSLFVPSPLQVEEYSIEPLSPKQVYSHSASSLPSPSHHPSMHRVMENSSSSFSSFSSSSPLFPIEHSLSSLPLSSPSTDSNHSPILHCDPTVIIFSPFLCI